MNPLAIAVSIASLGVLAFTVIVDRFGRAITREAPTTADEPSCLRCRWFRREHGRFEFPTCLLCGEPDTFTNVIRIESKRGKS